MKNQNEGGGALFSKKTYVTVIAAAFLFISTALGFTAWLNILSFQQNYTDSLAGSYALAGKGVAGKLEYAMKYGKPLDNFFGISDLLTEVKQYLPAVENVLAVMPDGRIVADLQGKQTDRRLPSKLIEQLAAAQERFLANYFSTAQGDRQHVMIPIINNSKWAGSIDIIFQKQLIKVTVNRYVQQLVKELFILSLGATILFMLLFRFLVVDRGQQINLKILRLALITVLGLAQLTYGYSNYALFRLGYLNITRENAAIATQIIRNDIEAVIAKGVTYSELYRLETYLNQITGVIPEVAAIRLTGSQGRMLAVTAGVSDHGWQKAPLKFIFTKRLQPDFRGESGRLKVLLSQANINGKINAVLLDGVTVLAASFFLMWELTLLLMLVLRLKLTRDSETSGESIWDCGGIRPLAFITYQAMFLTAAFVPVMMKTFRQPLAGVPGELALGLPVSTEMFCGLLATVAAGYWIDRNGWQLTFATGLGFFVLGTLLSGVAREPLLFIAARGIVGIGTGQLIMAMRSCVISQGASDAARNAGIAALNAGAVSGVSCGVVCGAMLADRIGFAGVFFSAAGMVLLTLPFLLSKSSGSLKAVTGVKKADGSFGKFIFNPQVLGFFGLLLIPLGICAMFLDYYFPVFANQIGWSASNTGRAFLLNGLCSILLGPTLSRFAGQKLGMGRSMITAALITAGAILVFAAYGSLAAALVALVLLGIAESFGTAAQVGYFMNRAAVREYGEGKSLSYFSLVGKLGGMLGPMAFGGVAFLGAAAGTGVIATVVLGAIGLFMAFFRNSIKEQSCNEAD